MKVLVIDDEELACTNLAKKIFTLHPEFELRSEINPLRALEQIQIWKPNIVFLDVQMPVLDGFALLNQIPIEKRSFSLIFCTAYSEYAVKAFEEAAVDYLLKPVEPERLEQAIKRIGVNSKDLANSTTIETLIARSYLSRIYVKLRGNPTFLNVADISCFLSEAHETVVISNEREYICDLSLNSLEAKLDPEAFLRCHRCSIVNLSKVQSYDKKLEDLHVTGSPKRVGVSKRNRSELLL